MLLTPLCAILLFPAETMLFTLVGDLEGVLQPGRQVKIIIIHPPISTLGGGVHCCCQQALPRGGVGG